jgi:hypothetical protein
MTAFDVEGYRKAATAAGISKAEIENEIKFQTSAPAKTDPFEKDEGGFKLGSLEQVQERLGNDWWHLPAALAVVGAGIYGASKLMDDGDTPRSPPPPPPPPPPPGGSGMRIDPTFDVEPLPQQAPAPVDALQRQQQIQQITEANKQLGLGPKPAAPIVPPQFAPEATFGGAGVPPSPPYQPSTPITSAPLDAPAPTPTSGPGSPVTTIVNDTVKQMIQEAPPEGMYRDTSGKMVYPPEMSPAARAGAEAFAQQYPQHAAALEAEKRFGILGAGSADNNLFNAYGPELRKQILNEVNQGQLAGVYANYPERINPAIKALPPEAPLAKQLEALRANDPKGAVRGSLGISGAVMPDKMTMGPAASKALKAGGKAFLGVAMANAANAASQGDYIGAAKIAGPALDPTGILEAAISPESTARSITNVSPAFGFLSQLIASKADERAKKAYAEKVGAGRGVAPPSAYRR